MSKPLVILNRIRATFLPYNTKMRPIVYKCRERALVSWGATQITVSRLKGWPADLSWVRYARFYYEERRIERRLQVAESELPRRLAAVFREEEGEADRINNESEEREAALARKQDDHGEQEQDTFVPGWQDTSIADIRASARTQHDANRYFGAEKRRDLEREVDKFKKELWEFRTTFFRREARYYIVALPDQNEQGMWIDRQLTERGINAVRTMVRRERRERWEYFQIRIALALSIITLGIGIVNYLHRPSANQFELERRAPVGGEEKK